MRFVSTYGWVTSTWMVRFVRSRNELPEGLIVVDQSPSMKCWKCVEIALEMQILGRVRVVAAVSHCTCLKRCYTFPCEIVLSYRPHDQLYVASLFTIVYALNAASASNARFSLLASFFAATFSCWR